MIATNGDMLMFVLKHTGLPGLEGKRTYIATTATPGRHRRLYMKHPKSVAGHHFLGTTFGYAGATPTS